MISTGTPALLLSSGDRVPDLTFRFPRCAALALAAGSKSLCKNLLSQCRRKLSASSTVVARLLAVLLDFPAAMPCRLLLAPNPVKISARDPKFLFEAFVPGPAHLLSAVVGKSYHKPELYREKQAQKRLQLQCGADHAVWYKPKRPARWVCRRIAAAYGVSIDEIENI
eukprot:1338805-Rhodomonas_salina.1